MSYIAKKSEKSEKKTSTFSQKSRETVYKTAQIRNDTHIIATLEACGDDLSETREETRVKEQSQDKAGSSHESETRSSNRKADRGGLFEK